MLSNAGEERLLTSTINEASRRDLFNAKVRKICTSRCGVRMDPDVHILECHPDREDESNDAFAKIGGNDWRYVILKKPSLGSVGLRVEKYLEVQSTTVVSILKEKKKSAFALLDKSDYTG